MTIIFFSGNLHKAREIEAIFAPFKVRIYTDFMKPFSVVESGKTFSENAKIKLNALKSAIESQGFEAIFKGEVEQKDCILMAEDSGICVESLDNFPHIFSARFANLPPLASLRDSTQCVESWQSTKDSTDSENVARLIGELKAKGLNESKATFISCVACYKFGNSLENSSLGASCGDLANFECSQTPSLVSHSKFAKNSTTSTANTRIVDSNKNDSRGSIFRRFCGFSSARRENRTDSSIDEAEREESRKSVKKTNAQITTHGFLNGKVICDIRGDNGFGYDPIFIPNGFESTLAEMPSESKNALSHRKNALDLMRLILCPLSAKNLS